MMSTDHEGRRRKTVEIVRDDQTITGGRSVIGPVDDEAVARTLLEATLFEIKRVIVGQEELLERVFVALLACGHLLIEAVPGLAKTLTVKTVADVVGGSFSRIQFTSDLVPAD